MADTRANRNRELPVGKTVRFWREKRGLTQAQVSQRTGLMRSYLSNVENGYTMPDLVSLARLAEALDLGPHILVRSIFRMKTHLESGDPLPETQTA